MPRHGGLLIILFGICQLQINGYIYRSGVELVKQIDVINPRYSTNANTMTTPSCGDFDGDGDLDW